MKVVYCRRPNSAERELVKALEEIDGIAFLGYMAVSGNRDREIDVVLLTPLNMIAIEVKAPIKRRQETSDVIARLNAPWTISGELADFYGGPQPTTQGRVASQILAQYLKSQELIEKPPFIQAMVTVSGVNLTMEHGPKPLGQTVACLSKDVVPALDLLRKKPIPLDQASMLIAAMGLDEFGPSQQELEKEWRNYDELVATIPTPPPQEPRKKKVVEKVIITIAEDEEDSRREVITNYATNTFSILTIMFLFLYFVANSGMADFAWSLVTYVFK